MSIQVEEITEPFEEMSKFDLQQLLIQREKELNESNKLSNEFKTTIHSLESQITDHVQRYNILKKNYDEASFNNLSILWGHCAQFHPELSSIPSCESDTIVENEIQIDRYTIQDFLGEGTYAIVKTCQLIPQSKETSSITDTNVYAVKIIDKVKIKTFLTLKRLSDEISVLKRLDSPNVIGFKDVIHTNRYLYLITDKGGTDMFEFLHNNPGKIDESLAREIIVGVMNGVNYIHEQGICHRGMLLFSINTQMFCSKLN